ncbi:hypothetical protein SNEBB_009794 [Seison nebaliae]|nr:hypothetical protein SNEBB_009794 [Seison nebaliae]
MGRPNKKPKPSSGKAKKKGKQKKGKGAHLSGSSVAKSKQMSHQPNITYLSASKILKPKSSKSLTVAMAKKVENPLVRTASMVERNDFLKSAEMKQRFSKPSKLSLPSNKIDMKNISISTTPPKNGKRENTKPPKKDGKKIGKEKKNGKKEGKKDKEKKDKNNKTDIPPNAPEGKGDSQSFKEIEKKISEKSPLAAQGSAVERAASPQIIEEKASLQNHQMLGLASGMSGELTLLTQTSGNSLQERVTGNIEQFHCEEDFPKGKSLQTIDLQGRHRLEMTKVKNSAAVLRIQRDLEELLLPPKCDITFNDTNNLLIFHVILTVDEGIYRGYYYAFRFTIDEDYPHKPPKVRCLTPLYHPNIDEDGNVCLNVLREDWKPILSLNAIIYGLIHLFHEPNIHDPLNQNAADDMVKRMDLFLAKTRQNPGDTKSKKIISSISENYPNFRNKWDSYHWVYR